MGLFKTDEEKAAEKAERDRANAAYAQQQAEAQRAFLAERAAAAEAATPLGQAARATREGLPFLELQLEISELAGEAGMGAASANERQSTDHVQILGQVEAMGWRLEHAGYVFVETGLISTDKVLVSGQATAVRGKTVGIYLFRRVATPPASSG